MPAWRDVLLLIWTLNSLAFLLIVWTEGVRR